MADPGLNESIDKIVSSQPQTEAAENLRSVIFDLYNPKGSAARETFIKELRQGGQNNDVEALEKKGTIPKFEIYTKDSNLTSNKDFSDPKNPKDKVTVFNTFDPSVVGMITDKDVILLDTESKTHRETSLDSNKINRHLDDKTGNWYANTLNAQLSLQQQAHRLSNSDPAKAARLYQASFRLADQQMQNRDVSPDSLEFASEHSHRGSLLSDVDPNAAVKEYKTAQESYEKLYGPNHIETLRNQYNLLESDLKAHGATEENKKLFQTLQQRRINPDCPPEEVALFDRFVIGNIKNNVEALYPAKKR